MRPSASELLAALPAGARVAIDRASEPGVDQSTVMMHTDEAFEAVEFPLRRPGASVVFFDTLTPAQRALAKIKSRNPGLANHRSFALARGVSLRRWAGLDPPGVLEGEVTYDDHGQKRKGPLWHALMVEAGDLGKHLDALPIADQLEVLERAREYDLDLEDRWEPKLETLREEGRSWALRYMEQYEKSVPEIQRRTVRVPLLPLFLSLVRANVPIEPKWDILLPTIKRGTMSPLVRECIEALPPERRAAAIFGALEGPGPHLQCLALLFVLDELPMPELVPRMFECFEANGERMKPAERVRFEALAKKHPVLTRAVESTFQKGKKVKKLAFEPVAFSRSELSPIQKQQLAWIDRDSLDWSLVELFTVRDEKGAHRYDVTLHAGDDGVVYDAGTKKCAASFVQGGADGRNASLCIALDEALAAAKARTAPELA
jgi:hypothetical protein